MTKINSGKTSNFFIFTVFSAIFTLCLSCQEENRQGRSDNATDTIFATLPLPGGQEILSQLKQSADIVTTTVTIRKIAIYDSSKSERFAWQDPSTWKYGDRKCIIPIEVHIKYGYDLRDMKIDDIKITDDSTAIVVHLPKPKIIDAGYNAEIDEKSVISISTGMRSKIGHELEEEIRQKGYEAVLKEDLTKLIGNDIERNAKVLLEAMIKSMGYSSVTIETRRL